MNILFLCRFRGTPDGSQVSRSIIHGIVRGYIDNNLTDSLLPMIKDKVKLQRLKKPYSRILYIFLC